MSAPLVAVVDDDQRKPEKAKQIADRFMKRDKVKITVQFRGRELSHPELGHELIQRVIENLEDIAQVVQSWTSTWISAV